MSGSRLHLAEKFYFAPIILVFYVFYMGGVKDVSLHAALNRIQEAIIAAYKQREADLPSWLIKLHFEGLKDLLNIR